MERFLELIGVLLFIVADFFLKGFVLATLWSWFIVPLFNIAEISVLNATGLIIIKAFLFRKNGNMFEVSSSDRDKSIFIGYSFGIILDSLGILLAGWIVKSFM